MLSSELQAQLDKLCRGGLRHNAPLAPFTTFRIGGPAEHLAIFHDLSNLTTALNLLHKAQIPFLLLGGGSNVLISDAGIPGLTIINQCKAIHWPEHSKHNCVFTVEAGAPLAGLARASIGRGLAGLSWAVSIPGTVGGAIVGNAGAHGHDISEVLRSVQVWNAGQIEEWPASQLEFAYRSSKLKRLPPGQARILLAATLELEQDEDGRAEELARQAIQHRRRTQPTARSAGSIFKNPPGDYAGRLIEQAGLKGYCLGDACISAKHANFIINRGHATAAEVKALIDLAQNEVRRQFGIELELEILLLGDWRNTEH